jgi:hypothetical protein
MLLSLDRLLREPSKRREHRRLDMHLIQELTIPKGLPVRELQWVMKALE